jgi:nitroimidazol reductase NimA-like FMN-containing flavoprotein (pyridoxamine 5'-phosphate oxidase superfamily)
LETSVSEELKDVEASGAGSFTRTARTTLRRLPKRGSFERQTAYDILDEGFVCHVAFVSDGQPFVIPTAYGRVGDRLYLHGARASRMLKALGAGADVCVNVTLVDGLVLARSAFHHSINYRSVVVFGRARVVESVEEKTAALLAFMEHVVPGRWDEVREPTKQELDATLVLSLSLDEASAKVRTGPPIDDEKDYELPIWAGVLPLRVSAGEAVADPRLREGTPPPGWLEEFDPANRYES